jgi:hypothetical protein
MIDEAMGMDQSCEMCGNMVDDCICPECPVCYTFGDPSCYHKHGLIVTTGQIGSLTHAQKKWEEEARDESDRMYEDYKEAESIFDEEV